MHDKFIYLRLAAASNKMLSVDNFVKDYAAFLLCSLLFIETVVRTVENQKYNKLPAAGNILNRNVGIQLFFLN